MVAVAVNEESNEVGVGGFVFRIVFVLCFCSLLSFLVLFIIVRRREEAAGQARSPVGTCAP